MNIKLEETRTKKVTLTADDVKAAIRAYIRHVIIPPSFCDITIGVRHDDYDFSMLEGITMVWEEAVTTARQE